MPDVVEPWLRNPKNYAREAAVVGLTDVVWQAGFCEKYRVDVDTFMNMRMVGMPWRVCYVDTTYVSHWTSEAGSKEDPLAVWPIWRGDRHTPKELEDVCRHPWGSLRSVYNDDTLPLSIRPKKDQEHRVFAIFPNITYAANKEFFCESVDLQKEYGVALHAHNVTGMSALIQGYAAYDIDIQPAVKMGWIYLPNGRKIKRQDLKEWKIWCHLLGFSLKDFFTFDSMTRFNLESIKWSGENFHRNLAWETRGFKTYDPVSLKKKQKYKEIPLTPINRKAQEDGDYMLCDLCSRQYTCQSYRKGAVCNVSGTDGAELQEMFQSRDSRQIIGALGKLLAKQTERLARGMAKENAEDRVDPEVTKAINALFDRGERLAKLVDPALANPSKAGPTGTTILLGAGAVRESNEAELAAAIFAELESKGYQPHQVTPDLVEKLMQMTAAEREDHLNQRALTPGL